MKKQRWADRGTYCTLHEADKARRLEERYQRKEYNIDLDPFSGKGSIVLSNMVKDGANIEDIQVEFKISYSIASKAYEWARREGV